MKRKLLCRIVGVFTVLAVMTGCALHASAAGETVALDSTNFPDAVFRNYLSEKYDKDSDGSLSAYEISSATGIWLNDTETTSLEGVEHLPALKAVYVDNTAVTELDLSNNPALEVVSSRDSALARLNVNGCAKLHTIDCTRAQLTRLDTSTNTALKYLYVNGNPLTSLDVSNCTNLKKLLCADTNIGALDVDNLTNLEYLHCYRCNLTELDLSSCVKLEVVDCAQNAITELKLGAHTALTYLSFKTNALTSLDCHRYESISLTCGAQNVDVTAYQDGDQIYIDMSPYALDSGRIYDMNFNKNSGTYDASTGHIVLNELPSIDDWVIYSYKYSADTDCNDGIKVQLNVTKIVDVEDIETPEPTPTEPKPTEPKPTEPKPTEPKPTEPEETKPEETRPEEIIPEETVPEETVPEEPKPEETIPVETWPEVTKPEETEPVETTTVDTVLNQKAETNENWWIWPAIGVVLMGVIVFIIILLKRKKD